MNRFDNLPPEKRRELSIRQLQRYERELWRMESVGRSRPEDKKHIRTCIGSLRERVRDLDREVRDHMQSPCLSIPSS